MRDHARRRSPPHAAFQAGCSLAQHRFPGDENAFAIVSSIPALWAALFFFAARVPKESILVLVALAGVPVMAGIGWVMDRVRVRKALWASLYPAVGLAAFYLMLRSFPSLERAISKNGSLWAYILLTANLGLYLSVPLSVVLTCISADHGGGPSTRTPPDFGEFSRVEAAARRSVPARSRRESLLLPRG